MNAKLIFTGLMLSASTALFAQAQAPAAPEGPKGGHHARMKSCSQEADPAKCEAQRKEMREKMHENMKGAREACKGKEGAERGKCMAQQMCAKAPDPAKCEAHAKERMERRHEKHEKGTPPAPKT
jgi:Spy/CpxP family protein refolding chaperone